MSSQNTSNHYSIYTFVQLCICLLFFICTHSPLVLVLFFMHLLLLSFIYSYTHPVFIYSLLFIPPSITFSLSFLSLSFSVTLCLTVSLLICLFMSLSISPSFSFSSFCSPKVFLFLFYILFLKCSHTNLCAKDINVCSSLWSGVCVCESCVWSVCVRGCDFKKKSGGMNLD